MVLFSPVPPARCATKHHTLLSLSNIWVDSTTFQSLSVIRRVSFQFLRFRPIYFLDSCFSSSLNRSLFHLPRASPASGQVGAQREQRPWSAFPPSPRSWQRGDTFSVQGTSSLPHLPGFRQPVLRSRESEIHEVAGLDFSGQLSGRGR